MGMQSLSSKGLKGLAGFGSEERGLGLEAGPIGVVAEQRVADMGEMYPDLMSAAGFQPTRKEARDPLAVGSQIRLEPLPVGDRLAPARADRLLVTCLGMAVERGVDRALRPLRRAPNEGQIGALQRA